MLHSRNGLTFFLFFVEESTTQSGGIEQSLNSTMLGQEPLLVMHVAPGMQKKLTISLQQVHPNLRDVLPSRLQRLHHRSGISHTLSRYICFFPFLSSCYSSTNNKRLTQPEALGIHQVHLHVFALQWIFAFVITAILSLTSLAIMVPGAFGKELTFRWKGDIVGPDLERRPLLDDE